MAQDRRSIPRRGVLGIEHSVSTPQFQPDLICRDNLTDSRFNYVLIEISLSAIQGIIITLILDMIVNTLLAIVQT